MSAFALIPAQRAFAAGVVAASYSSRPAAAEDRQRPCQRGSRPSVKAAWNSA